LAAIAALFSLTPDLPAHAQSAQHPLDPLTWDEHWTVVEALETAGHVDSQTGFSMVTLATPDKHTVLAWSPGDPMPRAALAIVKQGSQTFEAEIDLANGELVRWEEIAGVQPNWLEKEFAVADEILRQNPEWQEAMKRRGYDDLTHIACDAIPPGYFGLYPGRRVATVLCVDTQRARTFPYTRLIGGLIAVVDMNTRELIQIVDDGAVPMPAAEARYDSDAIQSTEKKTPISVEQPLGPSFELSGHQVTWGNWSFHHRVDPRVGVVISQVAFKDGDRERSVLYEGHLSEIFVPYMDPSTPWYSFNFLDAGEFPAGGLAKPMAPGLDCPDNAVFFDGIVAGDDGKPSTMPNLACIFERYAGDVAWRHSDHYSGTIESRPKRDLVVRFFAVLGNYDYNFDWIFQEDGTIQVKLAATGIAAVKPVHARMAMAAGTNGSNGSNGSGAANGADEYGRFVDPNIVAVNHDHYFSFRLDLDVDGPNNSLQFDRLETVELPEDHPRRSIWVVNSSIAPSEADAMRRINWERPVMWRVINPQEQNHVGYNTSYQLKPRSNGVSLMTPDDYPQRRAGFIDNHLWVTPYSSDERYAAGAYPTLSEPGQGLPAWTSGDRSIVETDIVLWYTVGMHHVVRAEDWPVMPSAWQAFELRPFDFFDRNPALGVSKRP
jgi:primary-amine oxidase